MKCSQCEEEDKKSAVSILGTTVTAMATNEFYDEDGNYHFHDMNSKTTSYKCSNGHEWTNSITPVCWCQKPKEGE